MSLFLENGYTSLNKVNEELCGDRVDVKVVDDTMTLVLADGLGSGVKANILSTLTSKILSTMISNNVAIEDCVETILQSLPICKVRNIAYSTFSIIQLNKNGEGVLYEFDNPKAVFMRDGKCVEFEREEQNILGKIVFKTYLYLKKNDVIVIISDGVIHAGIGTTLNFGWQRNEVMQHLEKFVKKDMSARAISCLLANACNDLYLSEPGDDTTVAVVKLREEEKVSLLVGPPVNKSQDNYYISKFMSDEGKKIVCGGTSSKIVARYLNTEVETTLDYEDKEIPPIGYIKGIDLTTEGVLTLRKLLELSEKYLSSNDLTPKVFTKKDGASRIAQMLFEEATHITFYVGQSMNVAHLGLPIDITMKLKLVDSISKNLKKMGKVVVVNYD